MGRAVCHSQQANGGKKKSEFQLQSLEGFYSDEKYPERKVMEEYAGKLGLTYNQVRVWFSERRRKEKGRRKEVPRAIGNKGKWKSKNSGRELEASKSCEGDGVDSDLDSLNRPAGRMLPGRKDDSRQKPLARIQILLSKDYIIRSVFRKDGPALGIEFDSVPSARGFDSHASCSKRRPLAFINDNKRVLSKRKVPMLTDTNCCNLNSTSISTKKFGVGKGLMTVWHATNPGGGSPVGPSSFDRGIIQKLMCSNNSQKTTGGLYMQQRRKQATIFHNKIQEKRKHQQKRAKALLTKCNKNNLKQLLPSVECGLLVGDLKSQGQSKSLMMLMDDEELELTEARAGPNPFRCSAHLTSSGRSGCPLCKDMLGRFPPQSVNMNPPICFRPWVSSPEMVTKLFKVFRFMYTCTDRINICSFTLDEFAQAFQEKDSMLLGKVHICLLMVLLSKLHAGLSSGFPGASKDCRFIGFMHSVKQRDFDVGFWTRSLNALTWTEILRQVSVAAGYGSTRCPTRREALDKEDNDMAKYGLCPRTLKGELFCILSEQGSRGSKVSELARASQIVALGLSSGCDDLEYLISSTLSSDITLFEKIGTSTFRLRTCFLHKVDIGGSESDDSGSINDDYSSSSAASSSDESDYDTLELHSSLCVRPIVSYKDQKKKCKSTSKFVEIDESFSGEAWLLGLIEGDYSDLSIEEKLDALVALVNLTSSALCMGFDASVAVSPNVSNASKHRSGAKIKKIPSHVISVDSAASTAMEFQEGHSVESKQEHDGEAQKGRVDEPHQHPLQAINLGSDRRYNSYWLFLGPCDAGDPGHRRVYFESSEDGHWEVIDTKQALSSLMSALDGRGIREAHLFTSLEWREEYLSKAMTQYMECEAGVRHRKLTDSPDSEVFSGNGSSLISDVDNNVVPGECTATCAVSRGSLMAQTHRKCTDRNLNSDQLEAFDKWIWNSFCGSLNAVKYQKRSYRDALAHCSRCHDLFWRDEKHCTVCHTTFELDFDLDEKYTIHKATCESNVSLSSTHKVLPAKLQALKAAIHAIEAVTPEEALVGWTKSSHNLWGKRLRRTSSLPDLFQVVKDFVGALNQDWLSERASNLGSNVLDDTIVLFQTMPQTTAAFALWIVQLDNLVASHLEKTNSHIDVSMPQSKRLRTRSSGKSPGD